MPRLLALLALTIAAGIASRLTHTGAILIDKYLGDALYAVMVFLLFRFFLPRPRALPAAALTMAAIELFQLTHIAANLLHSSSLPLRLAARLLGTHFSPYDLLAYAAGLALCAALDKTPPASR